MLPLNARNLADLPADLPVPAYDRGALRTGIVHFGVGGFHRAHQAMYLDRLMSDGKALDWAICGVGVMPADRRMQQVMAAQDGLYTLVVKASDGSLEPRVIGSITEYLYAPDDPDAADSPVQSLAVAHQPVQIHGLVGPVEAADPEVHDPGPQRAAVVGRDRQVRGEIRQIPGIERQHLGCPPSAASADAACTPASHHPTRTQKRSRGAPPRDRLA